MHKVGKQPRAQGVVFDLDGTLIDSYEAIAESLNRARAHFGLEALATEEVRKLVGWGLESLMERNLGSERVEEAVRIFRQHYSRIYLGKTRLLPGASETVEALRQRGYRMGVATNKPEAFSAELIAGLGLARGITSVRGAKPGVRLKPEPDLLLAVLADLQLEPRETVYVGDMDVDIRTARAAGVAVVAVATGSASPDELRQAGAGVVLENLDELLGVL